MNIFAIYKKPKDFPDEFVVRRWEVTDDGKGVPREVVFKSKQIKELRDQLHGMGLFQLKRHQTDDPCIMETWI